VSRLYVETSALLRALLEGDAPLRDRLTGAQVVTSALTFTEAARALARARREGRLDARQAREVERWLAAFERSWDVLAVDPAVLGRARGELPAEPVRTLDAIHLASILELDESFGALTVVSCDARIRRNAEALGLPLAP
jgi:predicted nucleic acid-binding protein